MEVNVHLSPRLVVGTFSSEFHLKLFYLVGMIPFCSTGSGAGKVSPNPQGNISLRV